MKYILLESGGLQSFIGERTGLSRWQVILLISVLLLSALILCSGCFWRFFKKKRPKDKKKDGKKQVRESSFT